VTTLVVVVYTCATIGLAGLFVLLMFSEAPSNHHRGNHDLVKRQVHDHPQYHGRPGRHRQ
jgi:hypothetical protein